MGIKKQLPRKHAGKKVSAQQEKEIKQLQKNMIKNSLGKPVAWLEAKHEFFEKEEIQDKYLKQEEKNVDVKKEQESKKQSTVGTQKTPKQNEKKKEKSKKKVMTINETKLGITMVLNKEDCKKLGFDGNEPTREAIKEVRTRLEL